MSPGGVLISVIIPTRDRWPLLRRALGAALSQEDVELEVLVIDDASSDGTPERVAALKDARIRLIRHETNRGVAAARNAGIAAARGEWVAFLDDDDLWAPRRLAEHIACAEAAGADWVWGGVVCLDKRLGVVDVVNPPAPEVLGDMIHEYNAVGSPSAVMVRRETLERVGGFDEQLAVAADWDLWLRLLDSACGAASTRPLVGYVDHEANMHLREPEAFLREVEYMRRKFAVNGIPAPIGGAATTRWVAYGHRRMGRRRAAASLYWELARRYRNPKDVARIVRCFLESEPQRTRRRTLPDQVTADAWLKAFRGTGPEV